VGQPRFFIQILDATPGQPIGAEIQAILERESRYRVYLSGEPLADRPLNTDTRPDLIIPLLQVSKERAIKLLAMLREKNANPLLLPVLKPEDLNEMLDELSRWAEDFLVTPLRANEVLARVRRLLSWNKREKSNKPNERITQSAGLARLVGEDPVFVALKQKLPLIARHGAPVLLSGETGTGKELCARAPTILARETKDPFFRSTVGRSRWSCLKANCSAIRGALSPAHRQRRRA
jgi:DNA-binding NtrC family response regulator